MNHEILFRGLRADGKGWVEGDKCTFAGRHYIIPENQQFRDIEDPDLESSFVEVMPETVCLSTGVNDGNSTSPQHDTKLDISCCALLEELQLKLIAMSCFAQENLNEEADAVIKIIMNWIKKKRSQP